MAGVRQDGPLAAALIPEAGETEPLYELIELLFFAYRDFVGDPDRLLETFSFGRAHHRVIHFVDRNPGLTIAELLDILKITKQSLNRVLKELITQGFIESRLGIEDRRQRHLHLTETGQRLARDLASLQTRRIARAISECGASDALAARRFLGAMIEPELRPSVQKMIASKGPQK
ncbi:MAG: MarR family transcriptional regulator [Alphaproteobacteria bacterium]